MLLVQYAFVVLLIGVLLAAVVSFAVMGLAKVRRTHRLARDAHERGMRFFRDDPYDVPRRYAAFAAISSGHSPRANNVTDGRLAGRPVRAFDFRCEIGHGTRRSTRYYSIIVAETPLAHGPLLMWHDSDADLAPLAARSGERLLPEWSCRGSARLAAAVVGACGALAAAGASVELCGAALMVAAPARRGTPDYAVGFEAVEAIVRAIEEADADLYQPVANGSPA